MTSIKIKSGTGMPDFYIMPAVPRFKNGFILLTSHRFGVGVDINPTSQHVVKVRITGWDYD